MRYVVANWKMELSIARSVELAQEAKNFSERSASARNVAMVLCPSFTALSAVSYELKGTKIRLGAQDVHWAHRGAFTGEVSADDLIALGVTHVIVGHSERRTLMGETDEMIRKKIVQAAGRGLFPVLCVGETSEERDADQAEHRVEEQLASALDPERMRGVPFWVAYEPLWAIGSGTACDPHEAWTMALVIKRAVGKIFGGLPSEGLFEILYGGSVTPSNVRAYMSEHISGVLVGKASTREDLLGDLVSRINEEK